MENLEASAPPLRDQVTVSLAVKVWIAVVFSLIDLEDDESPALPEGPVMDAEVSSTSLTEIVRVWSEVLPAESVARATTI